MKKTTHPAPIHRLALRVREVGQLFNSMDPTPFLNKDLDPAAEAFIESWAIGYAPHCRFHITIHLEQLPDASDTESLLTNAIHNHFAFKADRTRSALRQLLQQGRVSLLIGIVFVSLCLLTADLIDKFGVPTGASIARESLTIVGWVAMWRPMQIFLYDWWPIWRQVALYRRLSAAHIQVLQGK